MAGCGGPSLFERHGVVLQATADSSEARATVAAMRPGFAIARLVDLPKPSVLEA